jgi:hypothetical protein
MTRDLEIELDEKLIEEHESSDGYGMELEFSAIRELELSTRIA